MQSGTEQQNHRKPDSLKLPTQHITEQLLWANSYWQLEFILAQCFESLDHDVFDLVLDTLEFKLLFYSPKHRECAYCVLLTITKQFRKGRLYNNIVFVNIIFSWLKLFIFPATCLLKIPFAQCIVSDYLCQQTILRLLRIIFVEVLEKVITKMRCVVDFF